MHRCINTLFHSPQISLSLYLHSLSYLRLPISTSPFPSPSPFPSLSPSPSISPSSSQTLSPSITQKIIIKNGDGQFACGVSYSWGHRLKIMLYLAETEYIETKGDNKIKRQKNIDSHNPRPLPNMPPSRPPLGSH